MRLNLGAADIVIPGYLSVDKCWPEAPFPASDHALADLELKWPWRDSSIEEVQAHDVIEHIADRIHFMNELWRVLKPGARATIITPNAYRGAGYFQDPTHKSPWCLNSFQYYLPTLRPALRKNYGIRAAFNIVSLSETLAPDFIEPVWKITAVLECVK